MDITIGSLELNRTDPAHIGTSVLNDSFKQSNIDGSVKKQGQFETYLLDAISEMNDQQVNVNNLQQKVIMDPDSVDIHDVTIAMAKAQMSLNLAQTVIDRVISGWNELSTSR